MDDIPPHIGKVVLILILGFLGVLALPPVDGVHTPENMKKTPRSQNFAINEAFSARLRVPDVETMDVIVTSYSSEPEQTWEN